MNALRLSLIVPVFNEEETVRPFLEASRPEVEKALALMGDGADAEWVFVNDGCSDNTEAVLSGLASKDPRIKLINLSRNFGKEAAMAAGLDWCSGDAVIPIDVDLQDPPEVIVELVRAWLDGAEVVNAKRANRSSDTRFKRTVAGLFYNIYNKMADHRIPDNVGDFRLLSRPAVEVIRKMPERARFNKGIFNWVGFKATTVEYTRDVRVAGTSKWRLWKLWNLALDGITASTTAPLRIWTYIGGIIALFSFGYAIYMIVSTLISGVDVPGYASLMVTILMLGGLQLVSFGVMGEYIGRIANEVRGRPVYVISSKVGF